MFQFDLYTIIFFVKFYTTFTIFNYRLLRQQRPVIYIIYIYILLSQIQDKLERPIAFASRTLTKCETNYSTIEKEALAIIWGINKSSGSQQSVKPIVCTIPLHNSSLDFAADVVVRCNDRPKIPNTFTTSRLSPSTNTLLLRWSESPASRYFVFVALILNPILAASRLSRCTPHMPSLLSC